MDISFSIVSKIPDRIFSSPTYSPMNIESEIVREHSKRQCVRIATWIGTDKRRFKELIDLFLRGEYRITQRAAWIIKHCADEHAELVMPYIDRMIGRMVEASVHDAVKRNVLRILQDIEIPRRLAGKVATLCFEWLASAKEPVAVKVFSMSVLANIAKQEPDLKNEIRILIDQQMPMGSAGFKSRGKRVLRQLETV
jgi:hypothetical protein